MNVMIQTLELRPLTPISDDPAYRESSLSDLDALTFRLLPDIRTEHLGANHIVDSICIDGLGHRGRGVRSTAEFLHQDLGKSVSIYRLPGHSGDQRSFSSIDEQDWFQVIDETFTRQVDPSHPVDVFGFSTGGGIAALLGHFHPELVRSLTLICTPLDYQNISQHLGLWFLQQCWQYSSHARDWLTANSRLSQDDPIELGLLDCTPEDWNGISVQFTYSTILSVKRLIRSVQGILGQIQCPVAIMAAHRDKYVSPERVERLIKNIQKKSGKEDLYVMSLPEGTTHNVPLTRHRGALHQHIGNWISTLDRKVPNSQDTSVSANFDFAW